MEAGLIKIVRSLNINWTHDSYFSLRRPIHGGMAGGEMSGRKCKDTLPRTDPCGTPIVREGPIVRPRIVFYSLSWKVIEDRMIGKDQR